MGDPGKPFTLSGVDKINHERENAVENKQKIDKLEDSVLSQTQDLDMTANHDGKFVCANDSLALIKLNDERENTLINKQKMDKLENSMLFQTQDLETTANHDGKFVCANDSVALIKVKKVGNNSLSASQSQYFQTPLTEPIPSKFGHYKPTQRSAEKEVVIENKVTKCTSRVCTPFSFSFIGCDSQCDCDESLNDSNAMVDGSFNDSQKVASIKDKVKQTDQILKERGVQFESRQPDAKRISNSQLSDFDVFDGSQRNDSQRILPDSRKISHSKIDHSQMLSQGSQLKPELVSGTQYHLGLQSQFLNTQNKSQFLNTQNKSQYVNMQNNSQIQSTSVFNQTGLIVDSQFNQTGAIVDSQDNEEVSDGDIFEDSFNNSALLSQVDELDTKTNVAGEKNGSKRTAERDPDVSSHTQSLMGSCNQRGTASHRKRQRRKSSLESDISSIELEMQRRRGNGNNVSNSSRGNSALKENSESAKMLVSNLRDRISGSDISTIVKVNTELQGSDACDEVVNIDRETSLVHDRAVDIGDRKNNDTSGVENRRLSEPVTPVVGGTLQDRLRKKLQVATGF